MCALAIAAVAIAASQAMVDRPRDPESQIAAPEGSIPQALLEEAGAVERAFEHSLDNLDPAMSDRELMLAVSRACRPGDDFEGEYRVIICRVGVREGDGVRVVRVELEYELRDSDFVLTRSLEIRRGLGGD